MASKSDREMPSLWLGRTKISKAGQEIRDIIPMSQKIHRGSQRQLLDHGRHFRLPPSAADNQTAQGMMGVNLSQGLEKFAMAFGPVIQPGHYSHHRFIGRNS